LINPNNPGSYRSAQIVAENLGIAQLASYVEALGYEGQLVDARLWNQQPEGSARLVKEFNPAVLGVSLICEQAVPWTNDFLKEFDNSPEGPICLAGGYFPTLQPEVALTLMPRLEAIVLGEGELVLEEMLLRLAKSPETWRDSAGICVRSAGPFFQRNPRPALVNDLDKLPWSRRYAAPLMDEAFEVLIEGSRGCKLACTFCAIRPFFQSNGESVWRGRTPESLVAEMVHVRQANSKLRKFRFVDPDFIGFEANGTKRALRLAGLIADRLPGIEFYVEARAQSVRGNGHVFRLLRDAGLREVFIGVESGSQRILDKINKNTTVDDIIDAVAALKDMGISVSFGFMMFTPWTKEEDLRANVAMLRTLGSVEFDKLFHEMDLIPGTPAIKQGQALGPIMAKQGTGYYTYPMSSLAERVRLCGRALELRHRDFMEKVWFLGKDVQRSIQTRRVGARELDQRVTDLNLKMFEFCIDALKTTVDQEKVTEEAVADACVSEFDNAVTTLGAEVQENYRFPRPEAIRQASKYNAVRRCDDLLKSN
jgi:radical SAM superfamily enzyme YgiQ (UPF0313 family)